MRRAPPAVLAAFAAGASAAMWVLHRRGRRPRQGALRGPERARFIHDADGSRFRARFELLDELGSGAYCQVLRCRDRETGTLLAAKRVDLHRSRLSRRASRDAVLAEADVHLSLSHPSVLRVEAVYEGDSDVWIVTELCRGGELFDQLARHRNLSEPVARRVMLQVLSALAYLHARGIMHRDIKPENVLLASDADGCWDVRLSDFGFARAASLEHGAATALCGSPYYCAPEVLRARSGASPYDTAADVFSAGVLLYVMLAGFLPFDQDELAEAARSRSSAHGAAACGGARGSSLRASASPGRRGGEGAGTRREAAASARGTAGWSPRGEDAGSFPSASVTASFSSATTASGPASTVDAGRAAAPDFTAPVWTHVRLVSRPPCECV